MKNSKFNLSSTLFGLVLTLFLLTTGCKKDDDNSDDFSTTAEDIGQSENVSAEIDNMTGQVARIGTFSPDNSTNPSFDQFNFSNCATITHDSINHIVTFDFGTGCTGNDGKVRSGKVLVNYSGTGYFDAGSSWTVSFDNYFVNSRHIEGTRSVVNNGLNTSGNMTWTIVAQNMKITRPDGTWRSWNSQRTREMVSGYNDSTWTNDVYVINGNSSGLNSNGESVSITLTNIRKDFSCHYITSGTMEITPSSHPVRTINFGNGTCDDVATVTRGGVSRTIQLRF
jgi:hypothetical protein